MVMKKLILLVFVFVWFFWVWFTADYAAGCVDGKITGDNNEQYNCKSCSSDWLYNFDQKKWWIDFYNRCCDWTSYSIIAWVWVWTERDECCEQWYEIIRWEDLRYECVLSCDWTIYWRNLDKCCPSPWVTYNPADNWNNKDCCEGLHVYHNWTNICCPYGTFWEDGTSSCISCDLWEVIPDNWQNNCNLWSNSCQWSTYTLPNWTTACCDWILEEDPNNPWQQVCVVNNYWDMGIELNSDCLINGQCSYNIYETLGIRKSDQNPSVTTFVQDIVLATTTFIGTVIAIVLVISWILFIMASIQWNPDFAKKAKQWIINSLIWLLLVVGSYSIVRLIQFLATAGWG